MGAAGWPADGEGATAAVAMGGASALPVATAAPPLSDTSTRSLRPYNSLASSPIERAVVVQIADVDVVARDDPQQIAVERE